MKVIPLIDIEFNRLRAVFPMQVKAPFGYTDFVGEYASAGFPRFGADGDIYSGNDGEVSNGNQGGVEFDTVSRCVYARSMFVMHDNILETRDYSGVVPAPATGPYGNPTVVWSGFTASSKQAVVTELDQAPPGFEKISVNAAVPLLINGPPVPGSWHIKGAPGGSATGCQGFTAVLLPLAGNETRTASPFLSLRWRVVGSNRGRIRWYAVSLQVGGKASIGLNDQTDSDGNPVYTGWTSIDNLKSGAGRADMLAPQNKGGLSAAAPTSTTTTPTSGTPTTVPLPPVPPNTPQLLEVRVIGGQMRLVLGAEDTPYQWPHPQADGTGTPDWLIDRWEVVGHDLVGAEWSVHLTKFQASAATISQDINTGVALDDSQTANMVFRTHYVPTLTDVSTGAVAPITPGASLDPTAIGWAPPGCTAVASFYDVFGTVVRYRLAWSATTTGTYRGVHYSDYTAAVRAVTMDIPGREYQVFSLPTILGNPADGYLPLPQKVDVYHEFDLSSLSISSRAEMTWNNFQGIWTNGYGTGYLDTRGHFATTIGMGIAGFSSGIRTEFTGIANTGFSNNWGGQGRDTVTMFCSDCWAMLDEPCWNLPWFDGWNVYYVMAFLAALGTITPSQLAFLSLVPAEAYDPSPGLDPSANYYMPVGVAGSPLTRFGNGMKLRDIMLKIANSIGFTLFFDVFGNLQFYKFQAPTFSTSGIKVFREVAGSSFGGPGLDEVWSGSYSSSLSDVRNSVTVIGVNALGPLWMPTVAHEYDNDSIFNDTVANYKGWPSPMVWADNIFAVPGFGDAAAVAMLNYLRIPDKPVSLSTWLPGDQGVYPGDLIQVLYTRSAASLYTFFVTGTHSCIENGQAARLDIQARLVPPEVFLPG